LISVHIFNKEINDRIEMSTFKISLDVLPLISQCPTVKQKVNKLKAKVYLFFIIFSIMEYLEMKDPTKNINAYNVRLEKCALSTFMIENTNGANISSTMIKSDIIDLF
jgi:hypothetical protein